MICNGCGRDRKGSKEHLLHAAIARAVLGVDPTVPGDDVRKLLRERLSQSLVVGADVERPAHLADKTIFGLLCRECNQGWANALEEEAGRRLGPFLDGSRPGDAQLLRRWACYFATKAFWADQWPAPLKTGFLQPVMQLLAYPDVQIGLSVRITRFDSVEKEPLFWLGTEILAQREYVFFVLRGVGWMVCRADPAGPSPRSRELENGLFLGQYPKVPLSQLPVFLPTAATAALQKQGFFKGVKVIGPPESGPRRSMAKARQPHDVACGL